MARLAPGSSTIPPPPDVPGVDLEEYVPRPLRDHLAVASGEAEHRQVTVAFLKLSDTDAAIDATADAARAARRARRRGRASACETYGITWLESDIDVGAVKLYLTGGAPVELGRRRGGHAARAARRDRRLRRTCRCAQASTAGTSSRATSAARTAAPTP